MNFGTLPESDADSDDDLTSLFSSADDLHGGGMYNWTLERKEYTLPNCASSAEVVGDIAEDVWGQVAVEPRAFDAQELPGPPQAPLTSPMFFHTSSDTSDSDEEIRMEVDTINEGQCALASAGTYE